MAETYQPIFEHTDFHFTIREGQNDLLVEVDKKADHDWLEQLRGLFKSAGGVDESAALASDAEFDQWKLKKTPQVANILRTLTEQDIASKYKYPPPRTIGGLMLSARKLAVPTGALSSPYPQPQQQYERASHGAAKEILDTEGKSYISKGYRVYDYSEKSIAVIPDIQNQEAKTILQTAFTELSGKYTRLYPEGTEGGRWAMGYIVAKSNEKAIAYISQLCENRDPRQLADFSNVKTHAPKLQQGPFVGGLGSTPQIALGSLLQRNAPPLAGLSVGAVPGLTKIPGIPAVGAVIGQTLPPLNIRFDALVKDLTSVAKLEKSTRKEGSAITEYYWGPKGEVDAALMKLSMPTVFTDLTADGARMVGVKYIEASS